LAGPGAGNIALRRNKVNISECVLYKVILAAIVAIPRIVATFATEGQPHAEPAPPLVMRGLDPRIHRQKSLHGMMDCPVKPGNDESKSRRHG
jgi:hypothetical protein